MTKCDGISEARSLRLDALTTHKVDRHKQDLIVEQDAERIAQATRGRAADIL